ncbi:GAF and ANTAR domain-containing protein [Nocardioides aestuarii]|uniref:GAF and ANTAR domain-containing protein n=1 Tax=Nocardioides aestuarii TaxID=252231 RepID=A0ABW4TQC3_9ACTN
MGLSIDAVREELDAAMSAVAPGIAAADELCAACVGLLEVDGAAVSMVYDGATRGTFGSSGAASRRLDEYQFTFGEGPCLDAVALGEVVHAADLDDPGEHRWPVFREAAIEDGVRGVFALPIMVTSVCVGALDLFRAAPGPLRGLHLAGARVAAELASSPLTTLITDLPRELPGEVSDPETWPDMDRIEVYQATGMLIAQLDVDADEALLRLRAHAVSTGQTASQVAWGILEGRLRLERDDHGGAGRGDR